MEKPVLVEWSQSPEHFFYLMPQATSRNGFRENGGIKSCHQKVQAYFHTSPFATDEWKNVDVDAQFFLYGQVHAFVIHTAVSVVQFKECRTAAFDVLELTDTNVIRKA